MNKIKMSKTLTHTTTINKIKNNNKKKLILNYTNAVLIIHNFLLAIIISIVANEVKQRTHLPLNGK